jgi:hypothetical protein
MVAKGVPATRLSGWRCHSCGYRESACLSLGVPRLRHSVGELQRPGGSSMMSNEPIDWSAVVTALAVLGVMTFLFLH